MTTSRQCQWIIRVLLVVMLVSVTENLISQPNPNPMQQCACRVPMPGGTAQCPMYFVITWVQSAVTECCYQSKQPGTPYSYSPLYDCNGHAGSGPTYVSDQIFATYCRSCLV